MAQASTPSDSGSLIEVIDMEVMEHQMDDFARSYSSGTPLFTREALSEIDEQIQLSAESMYLSDVDGSRRRHRLKAESWCQEQKTTELRIRYHSYQDIMNSNPQWLDNFLQPLSPITFGWTESNDESRYSSLSDLNASFSKHTMEWEQSNTHKFLKQLLENLDVTVKIDKIVCFGLGFLSNPHPYPERRSHIQHASALTMASALAKRHPNQNPTCIYAQDPGYTHLDKTFLSSIGVTVLSDPKGFLEVDERTLVFSVAPDVCVRQIVADLNRPAAMVWDTVSDDAEEKEEWREEERWGEMVWVAPYSTDPISSKVWSMIECYEAHSFPEDDNFGDVTIYVKK